MLLWAAISAGLKERRLLMPTLSCEIETLIAVFPASRRLLRPLEMNVKFEEYFSFEAILGDLVRWRIRGKDVGGTLPARKAWRRSGIRGREGVAPAIVRQRAVWRTVNRLLRDGTLADFRWGQALLKLVEDVRGRVSSKTITFDPPRMMDITKGYKNGRPEYRRVASFENLSDRVILSRMTAYVRDRLESVLSDSCYSFRKDNSVTHQTAVEHLQRYRTRFVDGSLFVGECDIEKFFDNIPHEAVRNRWAEIGFDPKAEKILEAYLKVYPLQHDDQGNRLLRRGLPQGGSLSTVLANMVLSVADDAVAKIDDGQLFYSRFCDDVVFVHPDEMACRRAMAAYADALLRLDLPMHPVEPFVYKPLGGMATPYYAIKSKGPFRWRQAMPGEANCAPWLSFLGSQIRFDGETRIRKESIEKHIRALGRETAKVVRELESGDMRNEDLGKRWFCRFRNRLIAKGVGYVTAKVEDCRMCWAGAFPNVTACADTKMQMRRLDRVREGMLTKVWRLLPEPLRLGHHRYKGRPFSYFGFLEKAVRPTNMTRRRIRVLPYSEL